MAGLTTMEDKPSQHIEELMDLLWSDLSDRTLEYEIRFGTKGFHDRITKIQYDNVIMQLKAVGFEFKQPTHTLKMQTTYTDPRTGHSKTSNVRTEIEGVHSIQSFCKTNHVNDKSSGRILPNISFLQKFAYKTTREGSSETKMVRPGDYRDFNFRVSLQEEKTLKFTNGLVQQLVNDWSDKKKTYRLINRIEGTSFAVPGIKVHMSMVQTSNTNDRHNMIPTYRAQDSGVFDSAERYELEIEYDIKFQRGRSNKTSATNSVKKTITNVLRGLQQTNFPIKYSEMDAVKNDYMQILHKGGRPSRRIYPKDFIGPSSISLERSNIVPLNSDSSVANIRNPYTVTDKADGLRKLLYIHKNGKIYMIDTNMNVQFTGAYTKSLGHLNSIVDGEHILLNREGRYINLFAAFDIYYIDGVDQRGNAFIAQQSEDLKQDPLSFRLPTLKNFIKTLNAEHLTGAEPIRITAKEFYYASGKSGTQSIFHYCDLILQNEHAHEYETDGLIFTPAHTGVGSDTIGEVLPPVKRTWTASFKWKPPEYNTVDFLVSTKKTQTGEEFIGNMYESGIDMSSTTQSLQYKTLVLRIGFDESKHGYINPCKDVYNDNLPEANKEEHWEKYKPVQFYPTNPTDYEAGICNVMLKDQGGADSLSSREMYTETGTESFGDNMIVEFRYDTTNEKFWRWIPIRVRYDKTSDYRKGLRNYGNAYHVANSVWSSIHFPITQHMIKTGEDIPEELSDDNVYYKRSGKTHTRALRDFHNLYVKRKLIMGVSKRGGSLIDLSVGKAGDFPKWIASKLKFVFGIDIASDNINNRLDGACARFLNYKRDYKVMPKALFVVGNTALNIKNGTACATEKGKQIVNAVFGTGPKDKKELGLGVYKQYGVGRDGFDVVSCQFSLHYFFQNSDTLGNFLRNVSETCAIGGYFIGTAYDGKTLFRQLADKEQGESLSTYIDEKKIWDLKKVYDSDEFNDDLSCLGYGIDVYQESINKTFREYLVNFDYLTQLLDNYGFELMTTTEAKEMKLPNATGMFEELYRTMKDEIKRETSSRRKNKTQLIVGSALDMTDSLGQQQISFLNRYFVYKKIRNVQSEQITSILMNKLPMETKAEELETHTAVDVATKDIKKIRRARKLSHKIKLKEVVTDAMPDETKST